MKAAFRLYRELLDAVPSSARRFLPVYSVALSALAALDAAALGLLAAVIGPLMNGDTLELPLLGAIEGPGLLALLGAVCLLIVAKGVLSVLVIWRATRTFARYELELGSRLFDSYLSSSWVERLRRNSADVVRLTDSSVSLAISGYLRPLTTVPGEIFSFITIVVVLAVVQPLVAAIALGYLLLLGAILFFWVTKRSRQAGQVALRYSLRSSRLITEMVGALKEVTLRGKSAEAASVVRSNRAHTTRARSNAQFLNQVPRYVLESGLIGGFVIVGVAGYLAGGFTGAMTAIALFGVAGFRMAPSVQRFQSVVSQLGVSEPHVRAVLDEIARSRASVTVRDRPERTMPDDPQRIELRDVGFSYGDPGAEAVRDVTLDIRFGNAIAFVGASGAGKSTMIDLLLGLMPPTRGSIAIDGIPLEDLATSWRRRVAYVPQDVSLFDASVAQNVALTWTDDYEPDRVVAALAKAQLLPTIEAREGGIRAPIGERGLMLSGGQRQRLGIARALYADPLVLVMDEATSALDTATEAAVTDAIRSLRGSMTIITVAHRLSTVQASDEIFFMRDGSVVAHGTFDQLVASVPDFALQARLAGLTDG